MKIEYANSISLSIRGRSMRRRSIPNVVRFDNDLGCGKRRNAACDRAGNFIERMNWSHDDVTVPYQIGAAQAFSRPTVLVDREAGLPHVVFIEAAWIRSIDRLCNQHWRAPMAAAPGRSGNRCIASGWDRK